MRRPHPRRERLIDGALAASASVGALVLAAVLGLLLVAAWPVISTHPGRFFDATWQPSAGHFGVGPLLAGSGLLVAGAMALAAPLGFGTAIFVREVVPPWLGTVLRRALAVLAATPSVVLGVWGLVTIVPRLARWHPPGASLLAGWIVLALMIVPTVTILIDAGLAALPVERRTAATALGLSRATILRHIVVPAALPAIASALAVGAARSLGETMAVMLVTGNVAQVPSSPFDPVRAMTANLALELPYATGDHRAALFAAALVLTLLVAALLGLALLVRREGTRA